VLAACFGCAKPAPHIAFDSTKHDFASVEEGEQVLHNFVVRNTGSAELRITEAKSTCGCTMVKVKESAITAGGSTTISVDIDTALKQGHVEREITVRSNDPAQPLVKLHITADVKNPHASLQGDIQAKIFRGRCAICHVDEGVGKLGEDLYLADCAMCHGFKGEGGFAPGLSNLDVSNAAVAKVVAKVIAEGSPTHRSMPGFSKAKGGPLSKEQIDSLVEYIKWQHTNSKPK
jgi:mono/diheme cytochrome c family protein